MSNRIFSDKFKSKLPSINNSNTIEHDLFRRVTGVTKPSNEDKYYSQDVSLVRGLLKFLVDAKETPIIRANKISWLAGRAIYIKSEDHLLPGGSAKGRAVFGIILQNIRDYIDQNPEQLKEISASNHPLQELLRRTFDDTTIIANSAGNHGISVTAVFNQLKKEYGINTKVVVYVPDSSPTFKQQRIINEGGQVIQYDGKADREKLLQDHVQKIRTAGGKALPYSTEPSKEVNGGFVGLGTEGSEISEWLNKRTSSLAPISDWEVRSPTSSGPTYGALLKFFGKSLRVVAVQDQRNGFFATELLQLAEKGEIKLTAEESERLQALNSKVISGSPENGLSTKKINGLTKEQIIKNNKLAVDPNNIKLVSEASMKLATGLLYIETRANKDIGAVLPEKAGAVAVASIIQESYRQKDFAEKLGEIINWSGLGYDKFIELTDLKPEELKSLGLEDLEKHAHFTVKSLFRLNNLRSDEKPVIAVLSGANRDQPLEIELRKFLAGDKSFDASLKLLEAFRDAHPKTIHEIFSRSETRAIKDKSGNDVTYHSGDVLKSAIEQAIGIQSTDKALNSKSGRRGLFSEVSNEVSASESLHWIRSTQRQVASFRQDFINTAYAIS